jgi:hypothetical protein
VWKYAPNPTTAPTTNSKTATSLMEASTPEKLKSIMEVVTPPIKTLLMNG